LQPASFAAFTRSVVFCVGGSVARTFRPVPPAEPPPPAATAITIAPAPAVPPGPVSGVPEPATLALAGLGLPLIGGIRLFRRKK